VRLRRHSQISLPGESMNPPESSAARGLVPPFGAG
jgi:hypothetical protein